MRSEERGVYIKAAPDGWEVVVIKGKKHRSIIIVTYTEQERERESLDGKKPMLLEGGVEQRSVDCS